MIIGYCRVSTLDQNLDLQKDALIRAGCEKFYEEYISGVKTDRPELTKVLADLKKGDTLVIWKLDRLGRSLKNLIEIVTDLETRGIALKTIVDNIDTTTASGKLFFHIMGALSQYERELIKIRLTAGIEAAKARGVKSGRKRLLDAHQVEVAKNLVAVGTHKDEVAKLLHVSPVTLWRYLQSA